MRKSKKRDKILEIFKKGDLLTAQQVSERLPEIDPATVYRNINKFVQEGIITEIKIKKGVSSYELMKDKHQHFICDNCDKIYPIHIKEEKLKDLIEEKDLDIESVELNIVGKCADCN